jgi:hypothetical protein
MFCPSKLCYADLLSFKGKLSFSRNGQGSQTELWPRAKSALSPQVNRLAEMLVTPTREGEVRPSDWADDPRPAVGSAPWQIQSRTGSDWSSEVR